jgi:site-specific recombinase XerD
MESHDVHDYEKRLERVFKTLEQTKTSERNKKILLKYKEFCLNEEELSIPRVVRVTYDLIRLANLLKKDFDKTTADDMKEVTVKLKNENISERTQYDFKVAIKKFYRWLRKADEYPEEVKWIKPKYNRENNKLPEELLTEDEIKLLVNKTTNTRDRAFVMVLYESGCRIGELLTLKIKNVSFDEYGSVILVNGKTGQRRVRIVSSTPLLTEWLNKHPFKDNPEISLWVSGNYKERKDKELTYTRVRCLLEHLRRKADIKKKVNPHNFRHSRATYLANYLTEAQMKEFFGWTQSSEMASVYVHLSGRDVDTALLKTYGIENEKNHKESELKPKKCIRCQLINPPTNNFCLRCGIALDKETIVGIIEKDMERKEADDVLDKIVKNKESRKILLELVKNALQNRE